MEGDSPDLDQAANHKLARRDLLYGGDERQKGIDDKIPDFLVQ
jgi:hypothetical protein